VLQPINVLGRKHSLHILLHYLRDRAFSLDLHQSDDHSRLPRRLEETFTFDCILGYVRPVCLRVQPHEGPVFLRKNSVRLLR